MGEWSNCSLSITASDECSALQVRNVFCQQTVAKGVASVIEDELCLAQDDRDKPDSIRPCDGQEDQQEGPDDADHGPKVLSQFVVMKYDSHLDLSGCVVPHRPLVGVQRLVRADGCAEAQRDVLRAREQVGVCAGRVGLRGGRAAQARVGGAVPGASGAVVRRRRVDRSGVDAMQREVW